MAQPLFCALLISVAPIVSASLGNSVPTYKICVESCRRDICDKDGYYFVRKDVITWPLLLLWRCSDDCRYRCMWGIVDLFTTKGWPPPQFHGKWPFVRIAGVQEPASALFSLVNLALHVRMFHKYLKEFSVSTPMFSVWAVYALVSINGWIWSTAFHTRDVPFTELMDYLSAFALVFSGAYSIGMRLLIDEKKTYSFAFTGICILFYINHALYLSAGEFDYGYNLVANILVGVFIFLISLFFAFQNWVHSQTRYLLMAVGILAASLYLEINDFPPLWWFLDAHALWHALTAPSIYLFWKFVIEDTRYLRRRKGKW